MPDSQPVTVLLVEDSRAQREMIRSALTTSGYRVTAIAAGLEALDLHHGAGHDVLLVDMVLPDITGIEVLARARAANPDQCVIMVTAAGSRLSVVEAIRAGADDALFLCGNTGSESPNDLSAQLDLTIARSLERRQLAKENRELRAKLAEASRLSDVVSLAGAAAHDMNQPLTVMSGITELLLMDADPDDPTFEDMETLRRATQRLCDIVGKLSAVTTYHRKRSAGEVEVKELARSAVAT